MMKPPNPDSLIAVVAVPHGTQEMLRYVMAQVIERAGEPTTAMSYDSKADAITYHLKLNDFDRELFVIAGGIDEVWVTTKARRES